jgi:hypothetical protein
MRTEHRDGTNIADRAWCALLVALAAVAFLGCGSSGVGARGANVPSRPARRPWRTQLAAPAIAACEHVVASATSLSASARREIEEPCRTMDERVHENEATMRAVCQELVSATSPSPDSPAVSRTEADCYAEYAKTIPASERTR